MKRDLLSLGVQLLVSSVLASCSTSPTDDTGGIEFRSGANQTDTAAAELVQPLRVHVRGVPESTTVVFESVSPETGNGAYISRANEDLFRAELVGRTDKHGELAVRIRIGTVTGSSFVRVSVPEHDLVDSARFGVRPAAVYSLSAAPSNTAILVGESYPITVIVMDQHGNPREGEPVQFTNPEGMVSFSAKSAHGVKTGQAEIGITSGIATGTIYASVVPDMALTRMTISGVTIVRTNGKPIQNIQRTLPYSVPSRMSWSRDGQRVTWDGAGALYSLDRSGVLRQLTDGENAAIHPYVSTDDAWVYYASQRDASWHLRRVHPDGTNDVEVLSTESQLTWPAPSPDGRLLAYISGTDLWMLDLTSGARQMLAEAGVSPVWSPDGSQIAFLGAGLRVIRPDGTGLRLLASTDWDPGLDWSSDGNWLVGAGYSGSSLFDLRQESFIYLPTSMHWFVPAMTP